MSSFLPRLMLVAVLTLAARGRDGAADEAETLLQAARSYMATCDYAKAVAILDQCIAKHPASAAAWSDRGQARYQLDDFAGALADLSRALELDPAVASVPHARALARRATGDFAGAAADLSRVLALDPKDDLAYLDRGVVRFLMEDVVGAQADLARAAEAGGGDRDLIALWTWVVRTQQGDMAAATVELGRYQAAMPKVPPEEEAYTAPLVALLAGRAEQVAISPEDLRDDTPTGRNRRCVTYFFVGVHARTRGSLQGALDAYGKAIAEGRSKLAEHHAAKRGVAEIDRLMGR